MTPTVRIIGVPMDYGTNRRGVDMGPSAIRYAGLASELESTGITTEDAGDLSLPRAEERNTPSTDLETDAVPYLEEVANVCDQLETHVANTLEAGAFPLVLGGDHSISIGSVGGSAATANVGLVWFDAHADINTPETSPSGNIHGMPLSAILGRGVFGEMDWARTPNVDESAIAYVGLRSIDERERALVRDSDMTAFTIADIDDRGIKAVVEDALRVAATDTDGIHVSLDLDWVDPQIAPGVGTPVRGGVTYREAHSALETVSSWNRDDSTGEIRSMDVVEVNPILDEQNETASLAVELTASTFGKRIL